MRKTMTPTNGIPQNGLARFLVCRSKHPIFYWGSRINHNSGKLLAQRYAVFRKLASHADDVDGDEVE